MASRTNLFQCDLFKFNIYKEENNYQIRFFFDPIINSTVSIGFYTNYLNLCQHSNTDKQPSYNNFLLEELLYNKNFSKNPKILISILNGGVLLEIKTSIKWNFYCLVFLPSKKWTTNSYAYLNKFNIRRKFSTFCDVQWQKVISSQMTEFWQILIL